MRTITQAVTRLPEVGTVDSDLKAKIVTVRYRDGRTAPDEIRRAIPLGLGQPPYHIQGLLPF